MTTSHLTHNKTHYWLLADLVLIIPQLTELSFHIMHIFLNPSSVQTWRTLLRKRTMFDSSLRFYTNVVTNCHFLDWQNDLSDWKKKHHMCDSWHNLKSNLRLEHSPPAALRGGSERFGNFSRESACYRRLRCRCHADLKSKMEICAKFEEVPSRRSCAIALRRTDNQKKNLSGHSGYLPHETSQSLVRVS